MLDPAVATVIEHVPRRRTARHTGRELTGQGPGKRPLLNAPYARTLTGVRDRRPSACFWAVARVGPELLRLNVEYLSQRESDRCSRI